MNTTPRLVALALATTASLLVAHAATITVDASRPGVRISPLMWGIFFEDINLSTDGGLYPEQVRNRSFEDAAEPEHWRLTATPTSPSEIGIDTSRPLNPLNRRSLRAKVEGRATLVNDGYYGMNLVQGAPYVFRTAARVADGFAGRIVVRLVDAGQALAQAEITGLGRDWKYHTLELTPTRGHAQASLELTLEGTGTVFLDMVSLMPKTTWKDRGLRPDLAEAMHALRPSFFRFPGGCWVEGEDLARMYNWKKTIGRPDVRTPLPNIWGYHATHGIGFHEYLQMAEDLGAEPLFCINVGMSHRENAPLDLMDQWVQDALDAIEYANGSTNTLWGGLRARQGHPAPFHLRYLEIGNENGGPAYAERWPLFVRAIQAKHPEIRLIANHWAGGYPHEPMPEIVDEHYYDTPEWFMAHAHHYDRYDRKGPKVFVGEYAVTRNTGLGNLRGALGEAAFMTGMERNADVVVMAAYAPLFCNANHKRWPVNLINFDSSRWFGIPSYHVQKLFSDHRGTVTLPTSVTAATVDEPPPSGAIGVGTWNTSAEFRNLKVTAPDGKLLLAPNFDRDSASWKKLGGGQWSVENGVLRQSAANREFVRALAGDRSWTDYTFELEARKLSGREGFLILFHNADDEDRTWWNLGGWENQRHGVEIGGTLDPKAGSIESGRWYAIKVEIRGLEVKCWLDGRLVHDIRRTLRTVESLFASATRDESTHDTILKVVNVAAAPTEVDLDFTGVPPFSPMGQAIVLTSASPKDENTLDHPDRVTPKSEPVQIPGPRWKRSFPANSLTVLRLPAQR